MPLSERERQRRAAALQGLIARRELDALILVSNDYRGHKGALRWATDINLAHRFGYVLVAPDREPEALLPFNLAMGRPGGWEVPTRFPRHTAAGLVAWLGELGTVRRVGIVGLGQVMRVEEYLHLRDGLPEVEWLDVSLDFERLRAVKSEEELAGVRETTRIAERCFDRLLEVAEPGRTEREIGAEMYRRAYELGAEDPLFLSMYGEPGPDGRIRGRFGPPGDRVLTPTSIFIFSYEIIGPLGYWMEFSRMVAFGAQSELDWRVNQAVKAGMEAASAAMRPGADPRDVQRAILRAVEEHDARTTYWSGHGLGQDVIEEPWIGLDVVQDRDGAPDIRLESGMVLAVHPYVVDDQERAIGYMADSYVVGEGGGSAVSEVPLDLWVRP